MFLHGNRYTCVGSLCVCMCSYSDNVIFYIYWPLFSVALGEKIHTYTWYYYSILWDRTSDLKLLAISTNYFHCYKQDKVMCLIGGVSKNSKVSKSSILHGNLQTRSLKKQVLTELAIYTYSKDLYWSQDHPLWFSPYPRTSLELYATPKIIYILCYISYLLHGIVTYTGGIIFLCNRSSYVMANLSIFVLSHM